MSTTTSPTTGWTDARVRRARMFALLLIVCAVAATWAVFQPWFAWATPGLVPSCEPAPAGSATISVQTSGRQVLDGIAARGCVTGAQTVATYSSPTGAAAGVPAAQDLLPAKFTQTGPSAMLGLPRAATVLIGALALAWFGVVSRRGYLLVFAVFLMQLPHKDLTVLRATFAGDAMSSLTISMPALQVFTWSLLLATVFIVAAAIFVLKVNYQQRAEARRAASAAGEEAPPEALDPLLAFTGRQLGKIKNAAQESSTRAAVQSSSS